MRLATVACVVHWPISNALLNDIWLTCFTKPSSNPNIQDRNRGDATDGEFDALHETCNLNYWHKHNALWFS